MIASQSIRMEQPVNIQRVKKDFSNGSYGADRADSRISVSMVSSVRFVHGGAQAGQATDGFSYSVNTKDTGTKFPVV